MVRGSYFALLALFACFLWSALSIMIEHRNQLQGRLEQRPLALDADLDSSAIQALSARQSNKAADESGQSALKAATGELLADESRTPAGEPLQAASGAGEPKVAEIALDDVVQDDAQQEVADQGDEPATDIVEVQYGQAIDITAADSPQDDVTPGEPTSQATQSTASDVADPSEADTEVTLSVESETTPSAAGSPASGTTAALEAQEDGSDSPLEPVPDEALQNMEGPVFPSDEVPVYTDYKEAMKEAVEDRKLLCIYFQEPQLTTARWAFETETLADVEIQERLKRYVFVKLPLDAQITVDGQQITLLEHAAFAEMLHRQGVAIVDLAHVRSEYYGHVVSTFPFTPGKYYRKNALSIILDLPPGTLTQRTMIYAVRIHPEAPASTQGQFHTVLAEEAKSHAKYQAAILVQGHHSWDSRFHRINSRLPGGVLAQEVVAESWPNESLVEACIDCVHSWRQSPGHWGAVRSRHPLFGYDIKRGRNGIWYATGIFGRR